MRHHDLSQKCTPRKQDAMTGNSPTVHPHTFIWSSHVFIEDSMMMKSMLALLVLALSVSGCPATATAVIANGWVWEGASDKTEQNISNINSNLRGIPALEQQQEATPQHAPKMSTGNDHLQHNFVHNMLTNQGCPPTSSCGDVCYVLTISAASDLHYVATGKANHTSHHWNDPASFWRAGVCNSKAQCVSVNPFDKHHSFDELAHTLAEIETECERSIGMASLFLLAKAMDPFTRSCDGSVI